MGWNIKLVSSDIKNISPNNTIIDLLVHMIFLNNSKDLLSDINKKYQMKLDLTNEKLTNDLTKIMNII